MSVCVCFDLAVCTMSHTFLHFIHLQIFVSMRIKDYFLYEGKTLSLTNDHVHMWDIDEKCHFLNSFLWCVRVCVCVCCGVCVCAYEFCLFNILPEYICCTLFF